MSVPLSICQLAQAALGQPGAAALVEERVRLTAIYGPIEFFPACLHQPPCPEPKAGEWAALRSALPKAAALIDHCARRPSESEVAA